MRTGTMWLVTIACGLATQPISATDFNEIQLWIGGGITGHYSGFAARADGTLSTLTRSITTGVPHEVCARASGAEMATLTR